MLPKSSNHGHRFSRKLSLVGISLVSLLVVIMLLAGCSSAATTTPPTTTAVTTTAPTTTAVQATTAVPTTTATSPTPHANTEVILSSTTSVRDSGLMDKLIPVFEKESGYTVKPIYNGSGAALALGTKGEADVLVVHSPTAEKAFMDACSGSDRRLIMHNDFVILGPTSDPAGIKGSATAVDAFKKIAEAKAEFYSRGDNSGTDAKDKEVFKGAGVTVKDKSADNPSWYIESGSGMLQTLKIASDKAGYSLSDRATYLANKDTLALDVLFEGDPALLNLYHVIQVNPEKYPGIVNAEGAKAFADFIVGAEAQDIIGKYTDKNGQLLFTPDGGKTDADIGVK